MTYTQKWQMEPMFPKEGALDDLAVEVIRRSSALGCTLHPITQKAVVELVRVMNSYYSNLIEGHKTHPADIERALSRDYSAEPTMRALQLESAAHVEVQRRIEKRLEESPETDICTFEFLGWIHEEFYKRLPEEFLEVRTPKGEIRIVIPGQLRADLVEVGRHLPPEAESLPEFLKRFADAYGNPSLGQVQKVLASAASHHRLAWIHPFLDGNGRVTRLFTHAYLKTARLDGHGMWTVSRGLARQRTEYMAALADADSSRRGDLDGRGNLSESGLTEFCRFFLQTALDQIEFMAKTLELDAILRRIAGYVERQATLGKLDPEGVYLLQEAFLRGEMARGEASRVTGKPERTARRILKQLLENRLLTSETEKGPVRIAFPSKVAGYYFPNLYPENVEREEG
jgi:Fic family protein